MKHLLLILPSLFLILSCSARDEPNPEGNDRNFFDGFFKERTYSNAWDRNTKTKLIQGDFENYFEATVTFWNESLRRAFSKEMARVYRMTEAEAQVLESEELKENDRYFTFIVSVSSRELQWRALDREDYLWRMSLESLNGTIRVKPDRIEPIADRDDKWKFFYKSMNRFRSTFRVRFPRKLLEGESRVILHITGPLGGLSTGFDSDLSDDGKIK